LEPSFPPHNYIRTGANPTNTASDCKILFFGLSFTHLPFPPLLMPSFKPKKPFSLYLQFQPIAIPSLPGTVSWGVTHPILFLDKLIPSIQKTCGAFNNE
jgi:hypothetical protein